MCIDSRIKALVAIAALYESAASAAAAAPEPLALTWVIEQASSQSPRIAVARARWEATVEEVPQTRSLSDPKLYTMFWAVPHDTPNPFSAREVWVGVKQRFPYPGKLSLRGKVATRTADVAYERFKAEEEDVVHRAKRAYYDLYLICKELELTADHLELARDFSQIAESKYVAGTDGQGSVLKALIEISHLSNQLVALGQRRRQAEARLNTLLNRDTGSPLGEPVDVPMTALVHTLDELQLAAFEHRSEARGARVAIARSDAAIDLARKEFYPDFMADVSYWNVRDHQNQWQLMLEANVPIAFWSSDSYDARVRQAKIERRASEAALGDLQREISYAVESAFVGIQEAAVTVDHYRRVMIPQARQAVEIIRVGYETDREDFLSLLESERTLLRYELDLHRARVAYEESFADLERAVGIALEPGHGGRS